MSKKYIKVPIKDSIVLEVSFFGDYPTLQLTLPVNNGFGLDPHVSFEYDNWNGRFRVHYRRNNARIDNFYQVHPSNMRWDREFAKAIRFLRNANNHIVPLYKEDAYDCRIEDTECLPQNVVEGLLEEDGDEFNTWEMICMLDKMCAGGHLEFIPERTQTARMQYIGWLLHIKDN